MTVPYLGAEQLELLRRYNTPTVSNAIELFDVRPRNTGFLPHFVRCLLPELRVIVGYAVTCQTTAAPPEPGAGEDLLGDYLRYVAASRARRSPSVRNLTTRRGWASVRGSHGHYPQEARLRRPHHQRLPRNLDEVQALGFQLFGLNPCVSHAYVRLVDFGNPVTIGGVTIRSGDLLHADQHGVCTSDRDRSEAGRGLRGGGAARTPAAGDLPIAGVLARELHRARKLQSKTHE